MGKYFGTDGIRGVANGELTCELAFKTGQALAQVLCEQKNGKPTVLIGKDTRLSGDMLEGALVAGLCAMGANVKLLSVVPTPAVAYLTVAKNADAGIVISASHNPMEHNGIKIFSSRGYKLCDELEAKIESLIDQNSFKNKTAGEIGSVIRYDEGELLYISHISQAVEGDLSGLRLLIDCANGAASHTAKKLFDGLNANFDIICNNPNGININEKCGSTHLDELCKKTVEGGYDLGVAFDGDADRCLMVDEKGNLVDGDKIMAICAIDLKNKGRLAGSTFVATILSNIGLIKFANSQGINVVCANVGDRFVLEKMIEGSYVLGGEQSGHIIFSDFATTGDGQLTAIKLVEILKASGKKMSELMAQIVTYPQKMKNVKVDASLKKTIAQKEEVANEIKLCEQLLAGEGRILVRPSGTESLVRVMAEAKTIELVDEVVKRVATAIEKQMSK